MVDENMNPTTQEQLSEGNSLSASSQKNKRERKPRNKATATESKPLYALLKADGTYEEVEEDDLRVRAPEVVKDPTLRLVKMQLFEVEFSLKPVE